MSNKQGYRRAGFDKSKLSSRYTTLGPTCAPSRSFLFAVGLSEAEIAQPLVGVASCWNEAAPYNISLMGQAQLVKKGVAAAQGTPREFCTITVTDGIAMGHEGMKSSLVWRDLITDSVELTMRGHCYDGLVGLACCDKSLPGMMMAMVRLNVLSVFIYGGSILSGNFRGTAVTVQDVFEAVGIPLLMKAFLDDGYPHGDCRTVTGRTLAENMDHIGWNDKQDVVRSTSSPITKTGGVAGLKGNPAPDGAIVKVAGLAHQKFKGPARCFDSEEAAAGGAIGLIKDGDIIEIDAVAGTLDVELSEDELKKRQEGWKPRKHDFQSGALWKYAQAVGTARYGAVTYPGGKKETRCYANI